MIEELKRKDKEYPKGIEKIHNIDEYRPLIHKEIILLGRSYEELYNIYEDLGGEKLEFPLRTYRHHNQGDYLTPDFLMGENKLITNEKTKYQNFFKDIKNELRSCTSFSFMVSFIKNSGIQLLLRELDFLEDMGIRGRIITSTYLNITDTKALYKLLNYKNIEVKIYNEDKESFHTKAYLFQRENKLSSIIVGSSNLSHSALCSGKEWNIRLSESSYEDLYQKSLGEFDKVWNSHENYSLTKEFIDAYEIHKKKYENLSLDSFSFHQKAIKKGTEANVMQKEILNNLSKLRQEGKNKALVIAATGTGKTYLSAFDIKNFGGKKILFLAHREELLNNARDTYKLIFPHMTLGKIAMSEKNYDADIIFATIQSMKKDNILKYYKKDTFDYIVVDEFHHAGADTYLKILKYFEPKFLLGLTATPERMDGKDIMAITDYNIAGEIRLRDALELDLLAPFHYFGIADELIDYNTIKKVNGTFDTKDLSIKLSINERVDFIIEKIKHYDYDGDKLRAIAFCVNIDHAIYMSNEFNKRGFKTVYITARDNQSRRVEVLKDFHEGKIDIIFSIDIFNEGIDIPKINMLLFLRPTNSSTIFIQQLGRGLRKIKGKEFVTVLDFIGNYNRDYLLSEAFVEKGLNTYDKEILIRQVKNEFHSIPGSSFIELDRICQKRILDNLEKIKLNSTSTLTNLYLQVKNDLGSSPKLLDFLYGTSIDPKLFIGHFGSFYQCKKRMNDLSALELSFDNKKIDILERIESKLPIKWSFEYLLLYVLLTKEKITIDNLIEEAKIFFSATFDKEFHREVIEYSLKEMSTSEKNWDFALVDIDDNYISLGSILVEGVEDLGFKEYLKDSLLYGLYRYRDEFKPSINSDEQLVRYQDYSRAELQHLLLSPAQKGSWRAGYAIANKDLCLFITMNKDIDTQEHLMYDNFFRGEDLIQWISQNKTSHASPIGQLYLNHKEMGYKVHLFIRKYSTFGSSAMNFIYLGQVDYHSSHGDKPMYIMWKLQNKMPEELYLDLVSK